MSIIGLSPQAAFSQATVVYVDIDNNGPEDGSPDRPYNSITEGVASVADGGTVKVAPGTYTENLSINKSLTLQGSGLDVTTIDGGGQGNTITIATGGLTVNVEYFKITGGGANTQTSDSGLKSYPGSTLYARWNWFSGNGLHGVVSYGPDSIDHNLFTNNGDGNGSGYAIWASNSSTARIHNNTIRQSTIGDAGSNRVGVGIAISNDAVAGDIRNNIIADTFTAIKVLSGGVTPATTVDYNILWNNTANYSGISAGANDQTVDPKLTTTSYLNTGSPAINAGDPASNYNDRDGSRNDIGLRQHYLTGTTAYGNFATYIPAGQPLGLAAYQGSAVWLSSYIYQAGIYRLAAANGDPLQEMTVPGAANSGYGGLAYDAATDTLYHSDIYGSGIQKLDGGTGAIKATLPFTVASGGDLAFDGTYIWQAAGGWMDPKIYKLNAASGAVEDSFVSPVAGQTQTFGLAFTNNALWLSKGKHIYKIDPNTEAIICSFEAPLNDVRGLAFIPGYDMLAASFSQDRVMRFDLPSQCNENTTPGVTISFQWTPQETHTIQYQPAFSNEAVCVSRPRWQSSSFQSGNQLPKVTGGTIRGVRLQLAGADTLAVVSGNNLNGANLKECGNGLWAVWSASPAAWTAAGGALDIDWHPPRKAGITLSWQSGGNTQTLRFQHRIANEAICEPRTNDWASISLQSGNYLPVVSDPASSSRNYSGLRLHLASGDSLSADELDANTQLTDCGNGLWVIWSSSPSAFASAYGAISATWQSLQAQIKVNFAGQGAQIAHTLQWQAISENESACNTGEGSGQNSGGGTWTSISLQPGGAIPQGAGRGIRLKVTSDDLLSSLRLVGARVQKCGAGIYAIYEQDIDLWSQVSGFIIVDWGALFNNLDCIWFQHTETVDHSRDQSSHLWCQNDGTATVRYENGSTDTVTVVDGYARIPSGVNEVTPGGAFVGNLSATLKDRLPVTVHIVPVNLVDVGIGPPGLDLFLLPIDLGNIPFFNVLFEVESTIDVEGDDANEIWDNMETAMNAQPAVAGSDAYILVASSADNPVDYEKYFGQGPFDSWKGMFFLGHPTTFIHEMLHSLLGLKHVGDGPGPDPDWPYGLTNTFPEEATFYGNTQAGTWERLHFTGNDCDALMSYGNSNPYGLGSDYRVRCLSPFTGNKAWDEVSNYLAPAPAAVAAPANGPVMWLEGPDLFKFTLAHAETGNTATGPVLIANPDTSPITITVASYESDVSHFIDSFVNLPTGVNSATFDGRNYPPAFGNLTATTVISHTGNYTLTVQTECAWLLSADDGAGDRLVSGPYVGSRTVNVYDTSLNLQLSCADGESMQSLSYPVRIYLPLILR
ncbi:MAG: hypothetical protein ACE5H9_09980 [Anaerolineae bacterium]